MKYFTGDIFSDNAMMIEILLDSKLYTGTFNHRHDHLFKIINEISPQNYESLLSELRVRFRWLTDISARFSRLRSSNGTKSRLPHQYLSIKWSIAKLMILSHLCLSERSNLSRRRLNLPSSAPCWICLAKGHVGNCKGQKAVSRTPDPALWHLVKGSLGGTSTVYVICVIMRVILILADRLGKCVDWKWGNCNIVRIVEGKLQ